VSDEATGVASSVALSAGWQVELDAGETPDRVEVSLGPDGLTPPGDRARVPGRCPLLLGEVQLTVATDRVRAVQQHPRSRRTGATFEVPVGSGLGGRGLRARHR